METGETDTYSDNVRRDKCIATAIENGAVGYMECSAITGKGITEILVISALNAISQYQEINSVWDTRVKDLREKKIARKHWLDYKNSKLRDISWETSLPLNIANVVLFGSRAYDPLPDDSSDYDFVISYRYPPSEIAWEQNFDWLFSRGWLPPWGELVSFSHPFCMCAKQLKYNDAQCWVFSEAAFSVLLSSYVPFAVEAACLPCTQIWMGTRQRFSVVDTTKFKSSFLFVARRLWETARTLLELSFRGGQQPHTQQRLIGKKRLVHSVRLLMFAQQILSHGKIVDPHATQHLLKEILPKNCLSDILDSALPVFTDLSQSLSLSEPIPSPSFLVSQPISHLLKQTSRHLLETLPAFDLNLPTSTLVQIFSRFSPGDLCRYALTCRSAFLLLHNDAFVSRLCAKRGFTPALDSKKWIPIPHRYTRHLYTTTETDISKLPLLSPIELYKRSYAIERFASCSTECFQCNHSRRELDSSLLAAYERCWSILHLMDFQKFVDTNCSNTGTEPFFHFSLHHDLRDESIIWCCECTSENWINGRSQYGRAGLVCWAHLTPAGLEKANAILAKAAPAPLMAAKPCFYCSSTRLRPAQALIAQPSTSRHSYAHLKNQQLATNSFICENGHICTMTTAS
ncbi:hypothetical protein Pelo_16297 [Pelomyxa schiedti]|nr:hypothetical protein Pelo_16297 [Pelomyxa schiedti]